MPWLRRFTLLLPVLTGQVLFAQNIAGNGWSSWGVLPFRGYDFIVAKAPTRYILYFAKHSLTAPGESASDSLARAYSTDLKTWTLDTSDFCSTSGDLCSINPHNRAGVQQLADGRLRMFLNSGGNLTSAISPDGISWTKEPGIRLAADSSQIFERSTFALQLVSFVNLDDGSVRMYYEGGVSPGSAGTPSYYANCNGCGEILSAISRDNGTTWTREPGVRINPIVQGPVNSTGVFGSAIPANEFRCDDVSAVSVKENGRTVFRIYCPTFAEGPASYRSDDGLSFVLEGLVPADPGDPKAIALPDGRTWLVSNEFPDAIDDAIVYGPQAFFLNNIRADIGPNSGAPDTNSFQSALIGVTGTAPSAVSLEAIGGVTTCADPAEVCPFHPEYFALSPGSAKAPGAATLSWTGPQSYVPHQVILHATSGDVTAVGAVVCMKQVLGSSNADVFCQQKATALPLNHMDFAFALSFAPSGTSVKVVQTSNILSLGGSGYPFSVVSSVPWATVSPANGTAPAAISVTVDPALLAPGAHTGVVTITAEGTTETITLTATVAPGPLITAVVNAASGDTVIAPGSFVTIYGSGLAASGVTWNPTTALPTSLGGVSVQINGEPAYISYAGPGQVNVLTPPDVASGPGTMTVTTISGSASSTVQVGPVSPSWFTYNVNGPTWIAALIANTPLLVAPSGSLGSQPSRSAKAGDFLALYANGLGNTAPVARAGVVLTTAYAIDDLSRVRLTIGGHEVPVLYAGLVGAGLYQINVQVPSGLGTGELSVVMMVDGQITQGATLNFQ